MRDLTRQEQDVVDLLAHATGAYGQLPVVHPADRSEFVRAIHAAQNIVLARPAVEGTRSETTARLADQEEDARQAWARGEAALDRLERGD